VFLFGKEKLRLFQVGLLEEVEDSSLILTNRNLSLHREDKGTGWGRIL